VQKGFCHSKSSVDILAKFIEEINDRDLSSDVMVTNTGCFGICAKGPVAVVYPQGIWYGNLTPEHAEKIVEQHFENDTIVKELQI
jgi:(2Fe-2S) ferredoxin